MLWHCFLDQVSIIKHECLDWRKNSYLKGRQMYSCHLVLKPMGDNITCTLYEIDGKYWRRELS